MYQTLRRRDISNPNGARNSRNSSEDVDEKKMTSGLRTHKRWSIDSNSSFLLLTTILYTLVVTLTTRSLTQTLDPLPFNAPLDQFAEGRAMAIIQTLAGDIGHRQVSTPGEELTVQYLLDEGNRISKAASIDRSDIDVSVERQQTSGAVTMSVFGFEITNAFNNLTNVVITLRPKDERNASKKAVLINAHFDSTLGTVGASDCASCVAVALEVARTLATNSKYTIRTPYVFLLNGGEETLMQASFGFMTTSPHASNLGAFINIESTGPGGPDIVFQHTGDWTLRAYARAAPNPRGSSVAQDFFDMGVIPADTDFRMFRETLPGIDTAFVFDGTAYHTIRDEPSRIRPGTVQAMGENVLAAAMEFSKVLGGVPLSDKPEKGLVYFDLFSRYMVVYSASVARWIHHIPLAILIVLTLLNKIDIGPLIYGFLLALSSVVSSLLMSAGMGAAQALFSNMPMIWYGQPMIAHALFIPAGIAGVLLPYTLHSDKSLTARRDSFILGSGTLFAAAASLLTVCGLHSAFLFALWGFAAAGIALMYVKSHRLGTLQIVAPVALPLAVVSITSLYLSAHIMEKLGLVGSYPGVLGIVLSDVAVGIVSGTTVYLTSGILVAAVTAALGRKRTGWIAVCLLAISVGTSIFAKMTVVKHPYSYTHPKRILIQHIHKKDVSIWSFAAIDSIPIQTALPDQIRELATSSFSAQDWTALYPLNYLVDGIAKRAPPPPSDAVPPRLSIQEKVELRDRTRVYLLLDTIQPAWAVLNITGKVTGWSLNDKVAVTDDSIDVHMVRYAANAFTSTWEFWLDIPQGESVECTAYVKHLDATQPIKEIVSLLPEWVSPVAVTTWQSVLHISTQ